MRPLPPAPFLKDSADAIRDANVEGQRQFEAENPGMKGKDGSIHCCRFFGLMPLILFRNV